MLITAENISIINFLSRSLFVSLNEDKFEKLKTY